AAGASAAAASVASVASASSASGGGIGAPRGLLALLADGDCPVVPLQAQAAVVPLHGHQGAVGVGGVRDQVHRVGLAHPVEQHAGELDDDVVRDHQHPAAGQLLRDV